MRVRGLRTVVAMMLVLLTSMPAGALFHFAVIDEVMSGCGADPTIQFVEIRLLSSGQTVVGDTRLAAFSCDGSVVNRLILVPGPISNGMTGARWIIASAGFQAASGIVPDFVMTDNVPPGIFPNCGMICWGAPGTTPPDPSTWDPTNPGNYVDCVAYGPYTGPLGPGAGAVLGSIPNNGSQSLTRAGGAAFDNNFALATPSPTKNSGEVGSLAGCAGFTTTSTAPPGGGSTTSTTTSGGGTTSTTTGPALRGGGSAKTDCFSEWRVAGATGTTPVVTCTDNDPTCDSLATAGCVIRAQLCFNDATAAVYGGKCTASPVTAFALSGNPDAGTSGAVAAALTGIPGAAGSSFSPPLSALTCTGAIELSVPLKAKGTKIKKGSLTVKSVATAGKKDKDKLKLVCVP
jgi:hypothetical protein